MNPPIYVTIYMDSVGANHIIHTDSIVTAIHVGDTVNFSFTINNLWDHSIFERIIVGINDKTEVFPYQQACDTLQRLRPCPIVSIVGSDILCKDCSGSKNTTQLSPTTGGTWRSNNPSVATVNKNGLVTARSAGTVTFTDSFSHCEVESEPVTVKSQPTPDIRIQMRK